MATGNNRDVKMTLSIETLGSDEIKKLQSSVASLAKEGGDAAPEFQKLADEIGRLGEQSEALSAFQSLSDATTELSAKQAEAVADSERLRTKLDEAAQATLRAAQVQENAASAYKKAQQVKAELSGELTKLRAEYDAAGKKTDEYKNKLNELVDKQTANAKSITELADTRRKANSELTATENAEKRLQGQYDRSISKVDSLTKGLSQQQVVLDQQRQATEQLGLSTSNVAQSQAALLTSLNQTATAATNLKQELDANAAARAREADEARAAAQAYRDNVAALNNEIRFRQQLANERIAAAQRAQRTEQEAEAARSAAAKAEQAESDRLAKIVIANREAMFRAAQQELAAENAAFREAAAIQVRIDNDKKAQIEANARQSAQAIANAFDTVGAKSASGLRQQIQDVRTAMQTLSTQAGLTGNELNAAMTAGNARIRELERDLREATNQLTLADKASKLFSNSMGQITAGNLLADGIGYMVEKVKELGRAFVSSIVQIDTMRRALNAVYKDTTVTAQQIEFLRGAAAQAGVSFGGLANDFVKFSASTQSSNISLKDSNDLFNAVTKAAGSLGLGADKTGLALNALAQISSKGVVSMEELRQQLGDAIPGALSLTAKGLGVTDAELVKLVESGQLAARDFFPAFTKGLQTLQGETDGITNTWERFKNVLTLTAQNAGDSGWTVILGGALKVLGGFVSALSLGFSVLSEGMFTAGKAAIVLVEALRGNGAQAMQFFREEVDKSTQRLIAQANQMNYMLDPTEENRQRILALGAANKQLAGDSASSTQALVINTKELQAQATAAQNNAAGNRAASEAARISGNSATEASAKWTQLSVAMVKQVQEQKNQIAASEKAAKAAEIEGSNVERLAKLRGDEVSQINASVQASALNNDALTKVAVARQGEAAILQVQLNEMVKLAMAQDGTLEKRKEEIKVIQEKLVVAQKEAETATQAAERSRLERMEKELSAATYRDNSAALEQLRQTMVNANTVLEQTIAAEAQGKASKADVKAATEAATAATVLYNDALKDKVKNIDLSTKTQNANTAMATAALNVQMQEMKNLEATARLVGDENTVRYAKIEQKKIEIAIIEATVKAQIIEQQGIIDGLKLQRQDLEMRGLLTNERRIELDNAIKLAQAKITEAKARGMAVDALQREIDMLHLGTNVQNQNTQSVNQAGDAKDRETSLRERNAEWIQQENDKLAEQNGLLKLGSQYYNKAGWAANPDGSVISAQAPRLESLKLKQEAGTLGVGDLEMAKAAVEDELVKRKIASSFGGAGYAGSGRYDQAKAIYEQLLAQQASESGSRSGSSGGGSAGQTSSSVNINLNGMSTRINTASPSDAAALTGVFRQIESSAMRSAI